MAVVAVQLYNNNIYYPAIRRPAGFTYDIFGLAFAKYIQLYEVRQ